jgi:cytochrome c oxidase cbb3-type subunit 4
MSMGTIRGFLTLATFAAFIALWIWAWSKHRKDDFDAAAQLPLEDVDHAHAQGERS